MAAARGRLLLSVVATALCLASPVMAADDGARLKGLLEKGLARGYPGMAMLVEGPRGEVRAAVGYGDLEHHIAMRADDAFQICSVNKTFTAIAILRLVDQGRLRLDATLARLLGDKVARIPNAERITVAQLLDHSSGVYPTNNDPTYIGTLIGPKADPSRVWSLEEMTALADKDRQKPVAEPGAGHHYSDTNYLLLGMIVEKVTGETYRAHVARTIFKPLGMTSSFFLSDYLRAGAPEPWRADQGYLLATKELRAIVDINPMFKPVPGANRPEGDLLNTTRAAERLDPAAGIVSTLPDMAKFADALFHGRLLSPAAQKFLTAAREGMAAEPVGKHRTWTLQAAHEPYGVMLYKEGDGPGGFGTLMAYRPDTDEIFVGFTNSFGHFDEVDFMLDDVIAGMAAGKD